MPYESLPVVRAVKGVLARSADPDAALTGVLEAIGDSMGWLVGGFWEPEGHEGALRSRCVWAARIHKGAAFAEETGQLHLAPGAGLPGQVWTRRETVWIEDVGEHPDFPRGEAARTIGLHAAVGFPVQHRGRVLGVLEFFTDVLRAPVEALLPVFDALGRDIGAFMAGEGPPAPEPEEEARVEDAVADA
jgi:signal transduction protein with GAF and PtsI domain